MKQIFYLLFGLVLCSFVIYAIFAQPSARKNNYTVKFYPTVTPTISQVSLNNSQTNKILFVPYWSLNNNPIESDYDELVYFGITANEKGIDNNDQGYKKLTQFISVAPKNKKLLLALRLINTDLNTILLKDILLQRKIASQTAEIAASNGFSGVVLDFEISALGIGDIEKNISNFETTFAGVIKNNNLQIFTTAYGDNYARLRPFNIADISKQVDGIMVMAYDYHKPNGDPGPNFPLKDDDYSLEIMSNDFLKNVSAQKVAVIFGMYGYDWQIDDKGRSEDIATTYTDVQINDKFLNKCSFANCIWHRDTSSTETEINYLDGKGSKHVVWFEDATSSARKIDYLKTKGISSFGYWAYGYF